MQKYVVGNIETLSCLWGLFVLEEAKQLAQ